MKQTAVEWLIEQLSGHDLFNTRTENSFRNHNNMIKIEEIIEEAKEIEFIEKTKCYNIGFIAGHDSLAKSIHNIAIQKYEKKED